MNTFTLPEAMRINGLAELKDQLTPLVTSDDDLELDGAALASLDTSGLQLLIAAQKDLGKRGKKLSIVNASDALNNAIEMNEAHEYLNIA